MSDIWTAVKDSVYFANPEYLVFLPFAGVGLVLGVLAYYIKLRTRPAKTYGSSYPLIGTIRLWVFALVALTMMILASARPYFIYGATSFKRGNVDVPVALDVSASMWVKDVRPSRLELAVREIVNLYAEDILREGDRVALFVFGGTTVRKVHLSPNSERFLQEVGKIRPPATLTGDAFPWETDMASAFEHVYQSLDSQDRFMAGGEDWQPTRRSDRLVLVFSDGDYAADGEQMRRLDQAMSEFQRRGLKIYPIGIGTKTGVDLRDVLLDYKKGLDYDDALEGELEGIRTQLDTDMLSFLEQRSGGRTFILDNEELNATNFLKGVVSAHRSISFDLVADENKQEIWQYVLGLALLMFAAAIVFY